MQFNLGCLNPICSYSKKTDNLLGSYLAGLIEGDGSIIIRKGLHEKISPAIIFTFHKKEWLMFEKLRMVINSGIIYQEKTQEICRYRISNAEAVIKVINLINGYFRTPKIEALHRAIDNLNKWRNANLIKLSLDSSDIGSNAWLAGFTDADGHFAVKLLGSYATNGSNTRGRVQCVFSINQNEIRRVSGESCVPFMKKIASFFKCNLNYKIEKSDLFKEPAKKILFFVQSDKSYVLVINYFNKYPLMTSKYLNYLSYVEACDYLGKRLTTEEILEVREIKYSMNNKRTKFNWDHLNNFYS